MVLVVPTFVVSDKKNKAPVSLLRGRVFGGCEFHGRVFFRFVLWKFFDGLLRGRVFRRGEFHGVGFFWGASFTGSGFRGTGFSGKGSFREWGFWEVPFFCDVVRGFWCSREGVRYGYPSGYGVCLRGVCTGRESGAIRVYEYGCTGRGVRVYEYGCSVRGVLYGVCGTSVVRVRVCDTGLWEYGVCSTGV